MGEIKPLLTPEAVAAFRRFNEQFTQAITQTFERLAPVMRKFHDGMWDAYRKAGMPYGESEDGLLRWCEDIGQANRRQWEHERAQAMQDFTRLATERRRSGGQG